MKVWRTSALATMGDILWDTRAITIPRIYIPRRKCACATCLSRLVPPLTHWTCTLPRYWRLPNPLNLHTYSLHIALISAFFFLLLPVIPLITWSHQSYNLIFIYPAVAFVYIHLFIFSVASSIDFYARCQYHSFFPIA